MYKPENNLHEIRHDRAARKIFEAEAEKEARRAFEEVYLKKQDCNSVEELEEILQKECEQNLRATVQFMRERAGAAYCEAFEPCIAPEDSFEFLVQSMVIEERMRVYDEVIDEFRADDLESTDKN